MRLTAHKCSHPGCGRRMVRAYVRVTCRDGYRFKPIGWVCPACGTILMDEKKEVASLKSR